MGTTQYPPCWNLLSELWTDSESLQDNVLSRALAFLRVEGTVSCCLVSVKQM
jgi:hypothetical protein